MDKRSLSYFFYVLAIVSAFAALLQLVYWIGDKATSLPFHGGMLLIGSVL